MNLRATLNMTKGLYKKTLVTMEIIIITINKVENSFLFPIYFTSLCQLCITISVECNEKKQLLDYLYTLRTCEHVGKYSGE